MSFQDSEAFLGVVASLAQYLRKRQSCRPVTVIFELVRLATTNCINRVKLVRLSYTKYINCIKVGQLAA